ncbi:hypothetical protein J6590_108277 [Homalodisca vitripennis]|nr:hypothetical protein J6590_108277 [Homalodisca vitripennis]
MSVRQPVPARPHSTAHLSWAAPSSMTRTKSHTFYVYLCNATINLFHKRLLLRVTFTFTSIDLWLDSDSLYRPSIFTVTPDLSIDN